MGEPDTARQLAAGASADNGVDGRPGQRVPDRALVVAGRARFAADPFTDARRRRMVKRESAVVVARKPSADDDFYVACT